MKLLRTGIGLLALALAGVVASRANGAPPLLTTGDLLHSGYDDSLDGEESLPGTVIGEQRAKFVLGVDAHTTFVPLGDVVAGGFALGAPSVSADGSTVVGTTTSPSYSSEAFLWTNEAGLVRLGVGGADSSGAIGVSGDGSVVVGYVLYTEPDTDILPAYWTNGEIDGFTTASQQSWANATSGDGSVIVGVDLSRAFRWTSEGGKEYLDETDGRSSVASDISADGSTIVGHSTDSSGSEAFRWTSESGMVGLGDLLGGAFSSSASSVSADGSTIVGFGSVATGNEAFRWTSAGGMVALGDLAGGSFSSEASAVSGDGSTIVGFGTSASGVEAFIWDADNGMLELDQVLASVGLGAQLAGWTLTAATGISADGRVIVGYGTNPAGDVEGWRATIPEPHAAAGAMAALTAFAWLRARRHGFGRRARSVASD